MHADMKTKSILLFRTEEVLKSLSHLELPTYQGDNHNNKGGGSGMANQVLFLSPAHHLVQSVYYVVLLR